MAKTPEQIKIYTASYLLRHPDRIKRLRIEQNRRCYIWRVIKFDFFNILIDYKKIEVDLIN
jgi:hypothetical protein